MPHCNNALRTQFKSVILPLSVLSILVLMSNSSSYASQDNPYQSGYDHGCDDAGISDSSERYINQPEKGPSFHTNAFMNGYYDGLRECSGSSNIVNNDGEDGNNNNNGIREGNGAEDGKDEARSDFLNTNGRGKDPSCSPYEHTDAYCTAFKLAYEAQ